ncbi:hypothetical protein WICPIJ_000193 [Wickerhamomyces pijperi]|uniref:Uncharacterized protein n=1 Tax=Wickerhamomyces pijperi TaxID=599730 RepID=A0A9P8TR31_WICPI|nr:hypothetical protein WICPIJ_000193 [Wickerhamomyces pijperi]
MASKKCLYCLPSTAEAPTSRLKSSSPSSAMISSVMNKSSSKDLCGVANGFETPEPFFFLATPRTSSLIVLFKDEL